MTSAVDVIVTATSSDLTWLSQWQDQLEGSRLILAHPSKTKPEIPAGLHVPATFVSDTAEQEASLLSLRDRAILASTAPRLLFLAEGSAPGPIDQNVPTQVVAEHMTNLDRPSTPWFFNTLYDPYRPGTDFVRGYPFSLREGVKTAVSSGLAITSDNQHYVDATLTVPKNALTIFSSANMAVDRNLIGITLYGGLDHNGRPAGPGTNNSWTSFCTKAVCDHLGYGCKTGLPYVDCRQSPVYLRDSDQQQVQQGECNTKLQDAAVAFFQNLQLSPDTRHDVHAAYLELCTQVRKQLGPVDDHYLKVADGMEAWARAFSESHAN